LELDLRQYHIYTVDQLIESITSRLYNYYDFPQTVFTVSNDNAYIIFNAEDLDWLCENSEETEFWQYLRSKARYGIDFDGKYYKLEISTLNLKE
jgi:hypothetical protein